MLSTEYNKKITTDEELEAWKTTWDGKSPIPPEVNEYMLTVVLPRMNAEHAPFMNSIFKE